MSNGEKGEVNRVKEEEVAVDMEGKERVAGGG